MYISKGPHNLSVSLLTLTHNHPFTPSIRSTDSESGSFHYTPQFGRGWVPIIRTMPSFIRAMSRRDAILILMGAVSMHIFSSIVPFQHPSINITTRHSFGNPLPKDEILANPLLDLERVPPTIVALPQAESPLERPHPQPPPTSIALAAHLPETSVISHAPGWTLFRDIYMANGTLFILSSSPSGFPPIRDMTSTGLEALNTPENIAAREPTKHEMDFISPDEARRYWGADVKRGGRNRVWTIEGNTVSNLIQHSEAVMLV
jgi:hypothetical protein